ncbi:MAG: hypothetical protein WC455_11850 [Dehalococcoidia bacterium]|jgi:hypothetical protein
MNRIDKLTKRIEAIEAKLTPKFKAGDNVIVKESEIVWTIEEPHNIGTEPEATLSHPDYASIVRPLSWLHLAEKPKFIIGNRVIIKNRKGELIYLPYMVVNPIPDSLGHIEIFNKYEGHLRYIEESNCELITTTAKPKLKKGDLVIVNKVLDSSLDPNIRVPFAGRVVDDWEMPGNREEYIFIADDLNNGYIAKATECKLIPDEPTTHTPIKKGIKVLVKGKPYTALVTSEPSITGEVWVCSDDYFFYRKIRATDCELIQQPATIGHNTNYTELFDNIESQFDLVKALLDKDMIEEVRVQLNVLQKLLVIAMTPTMVCRKDVE